MPHDPSSIRLSPTDAERLQRWQAAGGPPIPLAVDDEGQVSLTTRQPHVILGSANPFMAAVVWWTRTWIDTTYPAAR